MTDLEHYLEYYVGLEEPGFAVLVTGAWGTGKTFQVTRAFRRIEKASSKKTAPIFVSLFGVSSPTEIDAAVVAASDPKADIGAKFANAASNLGRLMGGSYSLASAAGALAGPILRRSIESNSSRVLVVDDFERCVMPVEQSIGVLNTYVEEFGFKLVLIAHDEEVHNKFRKRKEKLIGQTIRVKPETDAACEFFINEYKGTKFEKILQKHRATIVAEFDKSHEPSLRVLKHVIADVSRFFAVLNDDQTNYESDIEFLAAMLAAYSISVRSGRLEREDFHDQTDRYVGMFEADNDDEKRALEASRERLQQFASTHNAAFIGNDALANTTLVKMLFDGRYDADEVQSQLSSSGLFETPLSERAWWLLWHRHERDDAELNLALADFEREFAERAYDRVVDVLHVCGLRISLAHEELTEDHCLERAEADCIRYIDDLRAAERIEPAERHDRRGSLDSWTGAYGLGYSSSSTEQTKDIFSRVFQHLMAARQAVLYERYPIYAGEIINLLGKDTDAALNAVESKLNGAGDRVADFELLPIFRDTSSTLFVEVLVKLSGSRLNRMLNILSTRYYGVKLHNGLDDEIDWILDVHNKIQSRSSDAKLSRWQRARLDIFGNNFNTGHFKQRKTELAKQGTELD